MAAVEEIGRDNNVVESEIARDDNLVDTNGTADPESGKGPGMSRKKKIYIIVGVGVLIAVIVAIVLGVTLGGNGDDSETTTPFPTTTEGPTEPTTRPTDPTDGPTDPTDRPTDPTDKPETTTEATLPPIDIDMDGFFDGKYSASAPGVIWTPSNSMLFRNENGDLILSKDGEEDSNVINHDSEAGKLLERSSRFIEMSSDEDYIAFSYDVNTVYRHTYKGPYAVYNIQNEQLYPIELARRDNSPLEIQNFVWSPSGSAMAFVYENNIYYKPSPSAATQQITTNGVVDVIYNGVPDWVYEEEVFSTHNAMWFSKQGDKLAYATFNDNEVETIYVPNYGEPGSLDHQYTKHHALRYPKVGTVNPTVTITLRDLSGPGQTTYTAPTSLDQPILLSVTFASNDKLALVWTNRVQNKMIVQICTDQSSSCTQIFEYDEPNGWIENNPLIFDANGDSFVTILPSDVGGVRYMQIMRVTPTGTGSFTATSLPNRAKTVKRIYKWTNDGVVWYSATSEDDSADQHIYTVDSQNRVNCFSCGIKRTNGDDCLYNDAQFSTDGSLLLVNCAGPGVPQWFLYRSTGEFVQNWELNEELSLIYENAQLPRKIRLQVPVADGYPDANVQIQVPHDYETRTNIPLLVYVYAGPNTAQVTNRWFLDWGTTLVARYGYAVAQIDGRGSGLRNVDYLFALNRNLGNVEVDDQIAVTEFLQKNLTWVDSSRVCIWGWSYGGYASTFALSRGRNVFKCAIAVAPVSDFKYYDTIYTERYMGTLDINPEGYKDSSLLNEDVVEGLRGKDYLLIHGTEDDNVHYQHAMELSYQLQVRNIPFDQMSYTDEDHALGGVDRHLHDYMEKFLEEHLGPQRPDRPLVITRSEFITGRYSTPVSRGTWVTDNLIVYRNENGNLVLHDLETDNTTNLLDESFAARQLLRRSSRFVQLSADRTHVAFSYDVKPVYRHSFLARYVIYNINTGAIQEVSPNEDGVEIQNFVWGPQGTSLAFVYKNDIYYKASVSANVDRITLNGVEDVIYNGIPDWVYEEEVFYSNIAMWFSNDGNSLAYATFDDNEVRKMYVPNYGVPGSRDHRYTEHHEMRYPKVGTVNPTVSVTLHGLDASTPRTYQAPSSLNEPLLLSVNFVGNNQIALKWTNRVQNEMIVQLCGPSCSTIFEYNEPNGWIQNSPLIFNSAGTSFITILPQEVKGIRFKQVVQVSNAGSGLWISRGRSNTPHAVREILRWTEDDVIWYIGTGIHDSADQHVFRIADSSTTCFSCNVRRPDRGTCLFNEASINFDGSKLILHCLGPDVPQSFIYQSDGTLVKNWQLNEALASRLENRLEPKRIRLQIRVVDGLPDADVLVQVPYNFEELDNIPVLVYVYAGPDTALVTNKWAIDWGTSLVTRYKIAIVHIDGRGSGLKNVDFMHAVNRELGNIDVADQLRCARHLPNVLNWLDRSRMCIWGWSYGGYMSSLALARDDVFKCGMAVAPVTDWKFYDSIYTERYMGTPQENINGYNRSSLLNTADIDGFRNKSYFLIHGTADDNVHYQHAMELSYRLQVNNVDFKQMSYTDEDHSLPGVRQHLYRDMENYLKKELALTSL